MNNADRAVAINMRGITKKFGSFTANDKIDLCVRQGEVHALLGENGAGKTTLMNQLYGLYQPTEGEICIHGKPTRVTSPNVAIANGIGMVHQHFMLVQPFTVAENIILGNETVRGMGVLDRKRAVREVEKLSKTYGLDVDPNAKIQDISVGMQQRVEILKVLYRGADTLIFDEPTAVLTPQEIEDFIGIVRRFTENGKTVIIITHKLKEILAMADVCTIIRRGVKIGTVDVKNTTESELAEKMVGRKVLFTVDKKDQQTGGVVLKIDGLGVKDRRGVTALDNFQLEVREGEIVGIAGVDGNGQEELVEALLGLRRTDSGSILLEGRDITNHTTRDILSRGVGSIPADRQKHGLAPGFTVEENLIVKDYRASGFCRHGVLRFDAIAEHARTQIEKYDIRTPSAQAKAQNLSGGNQQKVIVAREIANNPELLIASQPTRGLDVGAIEFIHSQIVNQRNRGKAVLLISFELDEIMDLSDRIAVIYEGKIVKVLNAAETDERELGRLMAGGRSE